MLGPRAWPALTLAAVARSEPEDFVVEERLGYELEGAGPHLWVRVVKRGVDTQQVAEDLARRAGVARVDVGYAGLKDRRAVAAQWFSVHLPGAGGDIPAWAAIEQPGYRVQEACWHRKKLRRGGHAGNRFVLRLGEVEGERDALAARVDLLRASGVPNYFGPQRFGRDGDNVARAREMFARRIRVRSRHLRGIYLSAARAHLFNQVLEARVERGSWNRVMDGDVLVADRGQRAFAASTAREAADGTLEAEVDGLRLHPTGPMWGRGPTPARGETAALEMAALTGEDDLRAGLEEAKLEQERRALRLRVDALTLEWEDARTARLGFELGRGAYATVILRELGAVRDAGRTGR